MMMNILSSMYLLIIILSLNACSNPSGSGQQYHVNANDTNTTANREPTRLETPMRADNVQKTKKATIMDQTLNMPLGTLTVPVDWHLHQHIASNPHDGGYLHFMLAMESPQGFIYGFLPFTTGYAFMNAYGNVSGMDFDHLMPHLMRYCTQPFIEKFTPGEPIHDPEALTTLDGRLAAESSQSLAAQAMSLGHAAQADPEIAAMKFTAFRNHVPYKGQIKAVKLGVIVQYDALSWSKYGSVTGLFMVAPESLFEEAAAIEMDKVVQFEMNEEWNQIRLRIIAQSSQDRMASQRQQFEMRQRSLATMRRSFDAHNQAWYDRNFGTSGTSSYSGNTAVLDAITGQTSFNDPYTGHQIKQSGHYDYWYTNEFGEYHGTNDPSFQPGAHYDGNWRSIQPASVDY